MNYIETNEKKRHGTPDFPIQLYHVDRSHPRYEMPIHWHREFEIIRVSSGKLTLFSDGEPSVLCCGDCALINSGALHMGKPDDCVYDCLVFDTDMLCRRHGDAVSAFLLPVASGEKVIRIGENTKNNPAFSQTVDRIFFGMESADPARPLLVFSSLYFLFWLLYRNGCITAAERSGAPAKRLSAMTAMTDYVARHFAEQITLGDLSRETGMSEKYICRFFKAFTGHTPVDYINGIRIENACDLLSEGVSVTDCAYRTGFNDLSYFSKTFRRHKGVTPSAYGKTK